MTELRAICKRFFPLFAKTAVFLADKAPKTRATEPVLTVATILTAERYVGDGGGATGRKAEKKSFPTKRVGKAGAALHFFQFSDIIKERGVRKERGTRPTPVKRKEKR